ncbi:hypothetical protein ABA45_11745 [Marinobacter psychrophilus]|uniref:Glycosyltransferase 2-like domain-containing protein n=1 Tax=Marinobacter psychrophilus TaxID=330734 RepID=A0A0H4I1X3_9GAMM|nr:hypothetical protein ABA45_11745 [Marinobacter psychrophilus]
MIEGRVSEVAVLIPTHAPGSYLEKCLKSINEQSLDKSKFLVYVALNGEESPYREYVENLLQDFFFNYVFFTWICLAFLTLETFLLKILQSRIFVLLTMTMF